MPGACSLASHIALEELRDAGGHQVVVVERGKNFDPAFRAINELGTVPALQTDAGQVVVESLAVLMHIADHAPSGRLAPPPGSAERDQMLALLSYMVTTAHPAFQMLWRSDRFIAPPHCQALERGAEPRLEAIFERLDECISERPYLAGDSFSVADAYLFVLGRWGLRLRKPTTLYPDLWRFTETMGAKPSVMRAMTTEGITLQGPKTGLG